LLSIDDVGKPHVYYVDKPHDPATKEKESQMLAPNTLLQDRYLVMRLLGQGGMGAVYQATDRKFGNAVALKETFYNDIQLRKAFSHEARLLNRLRHAALPVVTDYFAIGERQFLVMQYIPGKDLEQLLVERKERGQGVFLASQVLRWADQLLDALEYLHSQKPSIIHRDIKPQNLKLTPRGEVILLDFGLAKGITSNHSQASQSIRGYTPNYASLEQIRGTGTDPRSDIYSIGATLYHLLTGEMPQDAMTRIAAMLMSQPDPLPPINDLNPEVPAAVSAVIERAMSPHPDQRYASAAMMRQALRNASRNVPPVSFHRTPTLTDEPMKGGMAAAAAAAAVAFESLPQQEVMTATQTAAAKAGTGVDTDHVIILLEEGQQELPKSTPLVRPSNSKRTGSSSQPKAEAKRSRPLSRRRRRRSNVGLYTFLALLFMMTTSGVYLYRSKELKKLFFAAATNFIKTSQVNVGGPSLAMPMRVEAMRYYLEIESAGSESARATGLVPLAAGSKFKFHFRPRENGYLYIMALGKGGTLQTFLTDQPMAASGVVTNLVEANKDFQFPNGGELWFRIEPTADVTPFIVIFSPSPLRSPGFLAAASGRDLSENEMRELAALRKRLETSTPELLAIADNNQPAVTVSVPVERPSNQPLIFEISIKKK
jgi:serine/threonine protein kinase